LEENIVLEVILIRDYVHLTVVVEIVEIMVAEELVEHVLLGFNVIP
jgi:hypothetical protein